jgi:benzoate-CoA ligase family protein
VSAFNAAEWLVDRHVAEGRGDRVAVRCQGRSTTYAGLQRQVLQAQRQLAGFGLAAGDRVAMVVRDDERFPSYFLGSMRAGFVPVPLSTMLGGRDLGAIVADAGARVLVVSNAFAGVVDELLAAAPGVEHVVACDEAPAEPADTQIDAPPVAETTADTAAFWLYSSGTTGLPKGVMHVHGNLPATVRTYAEQVLQITPDDRFCSVAKLFFAYGLGNSLTFPLSVGATAVLDPDPPTPGAVAELVAAERPTLFFSSPGFCAAMLDAGPDPAVFDSVRATVTAGESLPANVHTRFAALTGSPVLDGIGSTELLHIFISNRLDDQVPGSSGRIVPGYAAELRDDTGSVVTEPDTPGYLHVQGESAAVGYWQRPEATAAAFLPDGWVRTGDVYTRSADDHWTFLGRNNDMIKAGGIWVSPAEVENALIGHETVLEVAVVGARDDAGLETVVAFVVPAADRTPDPAVLERHCRSQMPAFKRPRRIVVVDELPKTATGKIKRFELRQSLEGR